MKVNLRKLAALLLPFIIGTAVSHIIWSGQFSKHTDRVDGSLDSLVVVTCISTAQKNFYGDLLAADENLWLNARIYQESCAGILETRKVTADTAPLLGEIKSEWKKYGYLIEDLQELSTRLVEIPIEDLVDPDSEAYAVMEASEAKVEEIVFQGRKMDDLAEQYLGAAIVDASTNH